MQTFSTFTMSTCCRNKKDFFLLHFRSALPSAYNNWSPWAWDWWLDREQRDVIKAEKTASEENNKAADNKQATINESTKKT